MARLLFLLTTAILLGLAASASAEQIGRLFFSPDERAMLEQQRQKGGVAHTAAKRITLTGLVKRSSGKTTIWINQIPQNENESPQGIAIAGKASAPQAVPLLLPSGKRVEIKAGQTYDTASGKVREGYEGAQLPEEAAKQR